MIWYLIALDPERELIAKKLAERYSSLEYNKILIKFLIDKKNRVTMRDKFDGIARDVVTTFFRDFLRNWNSP